MENLSFIHKFKDLKLYLYIYSFTACTEMKTSDLKFYLKHLKYNSYYKSLM